MRKNPDELANQILKIVVEDCKGQLKFYNTLKKNSDKIESHLMAEEYGKQWFANYIHMRVEELEKDLYDG